MLFIKSNIKIINEKLSKKEKNIIIQNFLLHFHDISIQNQNQN
jgi:hypothetical protein